MAATTTLDAAGSSKKSFCIEALLARGDEPEDASASPSSVRSVSPPISPGSEDVAGFSGAPHLVPRPGLLAGSAAPSAVAAALFHQNHHLGHHAVYGYPNHHHHHLLSGGSAFHPLEAAAAAVAGGAKGAAGAPGSGAGPTGNQQHLQHMQLEWLARTGMFYPRLPDLTGINSNSRSRSSSN